MAKLDLDKAKGILSYIGLDDSVIESLPEETFLDDAKKKFDGTYHTEDTFTKSDAFKKIIGNLNGSRITSFKKIAKKYGVELSGDDLKDSNPEIAFDSFGTKLQSVNNAATEARIKELEEQAAASKDENTKKVEGQLEKERRDRIQLENLYKDEKTKVETQKAEYEIKLKTEKLDYHKESAHNRIEWGVTEKFMKKGFLSDFIEQFDGEFDENGKTLVAVDRKTGEKIPNPDKSKTFMEYEALLQREAIANNVWKMNPKGGDPAPRSPFMRETPPPAPGTPTVRTPGTPALAINTYSGFPGSNGK